MSTTTGWTSSAPSSRRLSQSRRPSSDKQSDEQSTMSARFSRQLDALPNAQRAIAPRRPSVKGLPRRAVTEPSNLVCIAYAFAVRGCASGCSALPMGALAAKRSDRRAGYRRSWKLGARSSLPLPEVAPPAIKAMEQYQDLPLLASMAELPAKRVLMEQELDDQLKEFFAQPSSESNVESDVETDSAEPEAEPALGLPIRWSRMLSDSIAEQSGLGRSAPSAHSCHEGEFSNHLERIRWKLQQIRDLGDRLETNYDEVLAAADSIEGLFRPVAPSAPKPIRRRSRQGTR